MKIIRFFKYRGKKIHASDNHLVSMLFLKVASILFLFTTFMYYAKSLSSIEWKKLKLLENDFSKFNVSSFAMNLITFALLLGCLLYLYRKYKIDHFKQLVHRQKLARMILENRWYEASTTTSSSFFKDLGNNQSKERITKFPKIYYQMKNGLLYIQVEIVLGKYQDQLLHLEKKLETGLYCELVSKELKDSFVEYVLLYDTISNRINIDDATVNDGKIRLMKNVYWNFDKLPHMLLAGGTGGGKTYFILTLIKALAETNTNLYILDPKNSDLADLDMILPNVYHKKDDMISCLNKFYDDMMSRNQQMKQMDGYKTGENYAYLGLPANFLIFDEYVAFMDAIGRESTDVMSKLKQIVMLGRQSGFFLILACQRPDAKYLGDGIRDQFNMRIALGRMSDLGYNMMFGETNKDFFLKQIKGRGYLDVGTNVISEFYTPLIPTDYNFLKSISFKTPINENDELS